jgi:hypothetical protein
MIVTATGMETAVVVEETEVMSCPEPSHLEMPAGQDLV